MDKKEKAEKKQVINQKISLAGGRLKDEEVDILYDMVSNPDAYNGRTVTERKSIDGFCSDGKYHRDMTTKFTVNSDSDGLYIYEECSCVDDDGDSPPDTHYKHNTGRDFLNTWRDHFKSKH